MEVLEKFKQILPISYTNEYLQKRDEGKIVYIDAKRIKISNILSRKHFFDSKFTSLCESIKKHGLIQPVSVTLNLDGTYNLISGERSLRACEILGITKIICMVLNLNDKTSALISLIENTERENLHFFTEAELFLNLCENHHFTQLDIASALGKTQSYVANKIRLLRLSQMVREIIKDNFLTERHARILLRLKEEKLQLKALEKISKNSLNVLQTDELVNKMLEEKELSKEKQTQKKDMEHIFSKAKDAKVFVNTFKRAISLMKKNGVEGVFEESENDDFFEYNVKINKEKDKD